MAAAINYDEIKLGAKIFCRDPDTGKLWRGVVVDRTKVSIMVQFPHLNFPSEFYEHEREQIEKVINTEKLS